MDITKFIDYLRRDSELGEKEKELKWKYVQRALAKRERGTLAS